MCESWEQQQSRGGNSSSSTHKRFFIFFRNPTPFYYSSVHIVVVVVRVEEREAEKRNYYERKVRPKWGFFHFVVRATVSIIQNLPTFEFAICCFSSNNFECKIEWRNSEAERKRASVEESDNTNGQAAVACFQLFCSLTTSRRLFKGATESICSR